MVPVPLTVDEATAAWSAMARHAEWTVDVGERSDMSAVADATTNIGAAAGAAPDSPAESDSVVPDLVAAAREGDREAQRRLFDAYHPELYRYVYRLTRNTDLADDLTQETFYRALRDMRRLRHNAAFRTWLYRTATNLVRDRAARTEHAWRVNDNQAALAAVPDPEADVTRSLEQADLAAAVERAVANLSPEHRQVVVLHHLQGLPVEDIAQVVGVRPGTVKSRLARARAILRRNLTPFVED